MLILFWIRGNWWLIYFLQTSHTSTISLSRHEQVCLMRLRFERYFSHHRAWWWEKYLSKRSLIKHTCSWRDKLIVLWTLNREAKIFLRKVIQAQENFWVGAWQLQAVLTLNNHANILSINEWFTTNTCYTTSFL